MEIGIGAYLLSLLVVSFFLWGLTYLFKFHEKRFSIALLASVIYFVAGQTFGFLFRFASSANIVLSIAISVGAGALLIKLLYREEWKKTLIVAAIWVLTPIILGYGVIEKKS